MPLYEGIEKLSNKDDNFQWGGERLFTNGRFATPDGKAHFSAVRSVRRQLHAGVFYVSTRRGKQFNSMVQRNVDPLTGAGREAILMSPEDAVRLGVHEGQSIRLTSATGIYMGVARMEKIKPGNLEVHWTEANSLLSCDEIERDSQEPDYNAVVTVEQV